MTLRDWLSKPIKTVAGKLGVDSRVGSLGRLMTALSAMVTDVAEGSGANAEVRGGWLPGKYH